MSTSFSATLRRRVLRLGGLACAAWIGGCGGGGMAVGGDVASEAEWRALRQPRPEPLPDAPRVTVSGVDFLAPYPWPDVGVDPGTGISELVTTGLLRRRDVDFVERRRFAPAAEAERNGERRPPGQPPAGVSRSAEYSLSAVWIALTDADASVEIRLTALPAGDVAGATRVRLPAAVDPVTLARAVVNGTLDVLEELGRLPDWDDPANVPGTPRVSREDIERFLRGLAAEERWNWEGARRGYQAAAATPGFYEAEAALARAARLRLGGTLAES